MSDAFDANKNGAQSALLSLRISHVFLVCHFLPPQHPVSWAPVNIDTLFNFFDVICVMYFKRTTFEMFSIDFFYISTRQASHNTLKYAIQNSHICLFQRLKSILKKIKHGGLQVSSELNDKKTLIFKAKILKCNNCTEVQLNSKRHLQSSRSVCTLENQFNICWTL